MIARKSKQQWAWDVLKMVVLQLEPDIEYSHKVRSRATGETVYEVATDGGLGDDEAQRVIADDLENLTVAAFEQKYMIHSP